MEKPLVLGIDIGGSHITAALVNLETRKIILASYRRRFVDSSDGADILIESWCDVINEAFEGSNITERIMGIAMPGPFDYVNGICLIKEQGKFQSLYKVDVKTELAERLNILPCNIGFINDAAGFLQGEVFAGAARNFGKSLGITLGTGLGSALHLNGVASDAALWDSDFLGGIAEDYLSTRWFIKRYEELSGRLLVGVKDLLALVKTDPNSALVFREFGHNLGRFISPLIKQHHLELVIIGGNISLAFNAFSAALEAALKAEQLTVAIKITTLQENAALIGAASCLDQQVNSKGGFDYPYAIKND